MNGETPIHHENRSLQRTVTCINLTKAEESRLHRFVVFGALLYAKAWTEAPFGAEAPRTDLQIWIDMGKFEKINPAYKAAR